MTDIPKKIVLATKNPGKARELRALLGGLGVEVLTLADLPPLEMPPEDEPTFRGNALEKARFVSRETGLPSLADDSGLEVDELGGRPGVRSARYAGPDATDRENWEKLLKELDGVPAERRSARFRCALAYVEPGGGEEIFDGTLEGVIAEGPSGEGGFGYDPVFFIPDKGKTAAGLAPDEKNSISHRGRALAGFVRRLAARNRGSKSDVSGPKKS